MSGSNVFKVNWEVLQFGQFCKKITQKYYNCLNAREGGFVAPIRTMHFYTSFGCVLCVKNSLTF